MKYFYLLFAVLFLVFAFVQVNDPDPALWIIIYGLMAVSCILAAFKIFYRPAILFQTGLYTALCFKLFDGVKTWWQQDDRTALFDDLAKMQYPYIEEAREFLGLLICIVILVIQLIHALRFKRST